MSENHLSQAPAIQELTSQGYEIRPLTLKDIDALYEIEAMNWAPWLRASRETLRGRSEVCPEGQIGVWDGNKLVAALSLARFNWDENPDHLPTWDQLAHDPNTFKTSYQPDGNAVVMISMNVHPEYQRQQLPQEVIKYVKKIAPSLSIRHVLGSFRPNQYWQWSGGRHPDDAFEEYCQSTRPDGEPLDAWLRNLKRNGMEPLMAQRNAMIVTVPLDEFRRYQREYHPEMWQPIDERKLTWKCGELGIWEIKETPGLAIYREPNLWGRMNHGHSE